MEEGDRVEKVELPSQVAVKFNYGWPQNIETLLGTFKESSDLLLEVRVADHLQAPSFSEMASAKRTNTAMK